MFMDCNKLGQKAPSCFEKFDILRIQGGVLPDYAKVYACLYELGQFFGVPWVWVDEAIIDRVLRCRRQLSQH